MDPHGIEINNAGGMSETYLVATGPSFRVEPLRDGRQDRGASVLLTGVGARTLFFVPQILQLFPALDGLQLAKLTALLVVIYIMDEFTPVAGSTSTAS
jgi:hypothetical protein